MPKSLLTRRGLGALGLSALAVPGRAQTRGGTVSMIITPEPPMLTGAFATTGPMQTVSPKIFDGLVSYDFDYKPRPQLATAWDVSADGLAIRFSLRPGVRWHDGKPFTSADLEWSLLNVWKTLHGRGRATYANVVAVETPDAGTAVLRLSKPSPAIMNALAAAESQILPRHIYEGTDIQTNPANNAPIGTGPFRFKEWRRGSAIVLERNPDYWDAPKPYIDQLVLRVIPDGAGRSAALESGEVLLAGDNPVPLADVQRLSQLPSLAIERRGYNSVNNIHFMEFNLRRPYFQDVRVRQAIAHAINRDFIARNIWFGQAHASTGPVPSAVKAYYSSDVPAYPVDLAAANRLLDEAGFKRGADGVRFKIFNDWAPYGEALQRTSEYLRQALKPVGIEVEVRSSDLPGWLRRVYTDNDFDTTTFYLSALSDPTIGIQRFYWSKNIQKGAVFTNGSGYNNPEMDRILEAAASEADTAKRVALFAEFQKLAMTDLPLIPLVDLDHVTFANKRVHDHTTGAYGLRDNQAEVWVTEA
jgi:peptide/nickel transport system substrate-binding protein